MRKVLSSTTVLGALLVVMSVASQAMAIPPTPRSNGSLHAQRFVDNGDGTVTDHQTGLMWEKKLAANNARGECANETQAFRSIQSSGIQFRPKFPLPPPTSECTPRNHTSTRRSASFSPVPFSHVN